MGKVVLRGDELVHFEDGNEEEVNLSHLRCYFEIEGEASVHDFVSACYDNDDLRYCFEKMFGGSSIWEVKFNSFELNYEAEIQDGYVYTNLVRSSYLEDNQLHITEDYDVVQDNKILMSGKRCPSLLEVARCIFNTEWSWEHPPLQFVGGKLLHDDGDDVYSSLPYLFEYVELNEDTTLLDLLNWVDERDDLCMFLAQYSWCRDIKAFHVEANMPDDVERIDDGHELSYAEVSSCLELDEYGKELWIDDHYDFHCVGPTSKETKELYETIDGDPPETETYGVSYSPVYHYSRLPLKVDETVEITKAAVFGRNGGLKKGKEVLCTVRRPTTLLDLLDTIYWDISFTGSPEQRDDFFEGLKGMVEGVKSGEIKTEPFDLGEENDS